MSLRLKRDVHHWSAWYPLRWRAENGAAMLGTYLDAADAEGRDRLSAADKVALVVGGLSARLEMVVPRVVRDRLATVMIGLLGAFGLITGLLFEWAPWATVERNAAYGTTAGLSFGPFLSPFVIVAILAFVAWLTSLVGPTWLYRSMLVATAVAGIVLEADAHFGFVGYSIWLRSTLCIFAVIVAALALIGARPRATQSATSAAGWALALYTTSVVFGSGMRGQPFTGMTDVFVFLSGDAQPLALYLGTLLTFLAALGLVIMHRRAAAAVLVLATSPWLPLVRVHTNAAAHGIFAIDLLLATPLIAGYGAAIVIAIVTHRARRTSTEGEAGIASLDAPYDLRQA